METDLAEPDLPSSVTFMFEYTGPVPGPLPGYALRGGSGWFKADELFTWFDTFEFRDSELPHILLFVLVSKPEN